MAAEFQAGMRTLVIGLEADMLVKAKSALLQVGLIVERQAKRNASSGAHRYGTKTPAFRGSGPARISGTLVRSISHTQVKMIGRDLEMKVGMGTGFFPPYGKSRTASSKYAYYLETGLRGGATYPFLNPAFKFATGFPADAIYKAKLGTGWKTYV